MRTQFIQEQIKTPSHAAAQLAQTELGALVSVLASKDAALRMAVEALERIESVCNDCSRVGAMIHPNELLELIEEVEPALAACREVMGEGE